MSVSTGENQNNKEEQELLSMRFSSETRTAIGPTVPNVKWKVVETTSIRTASKPETFTVKFLCPNSTTTWDLNIPKKSGCKLKHMPVKLVETGLYHIILEFASKTNLKKSMLLSETTKSKMKHRLQ